jgi:hypothetical protein
VGLVARANRFAVTVRPSVRGPVAIDRISITPDGSPSLAARVVTPQILLPFGPEKAQGVRMVDAP